jgi:type II secretion system protein H
VRLGRDIKHAVTGLPARSVAGFRGPLDGARLAVANARHGFTLIELILVMAVIVVMAAVVTPRMAGFFRGRTLDNEARRFLSLTRYAQNRAVSEGIPMLVWIDEAKQLYGVEAQPGYQERDALALEYRVAEELEIEAGNPLTTYGASNAQLVSRNLPTGLRFIRFTPDGFLSDSSAEDVLISHNQNDVVALGPGRNWQQ